MLLRLSVLHYRQRPPTESKAYEFDHKGGVIGREPGDEVVWVLPDEEAVVSKRHARIDYEAGVYYVTDISTNGLYVNESEVALGDQGERHAIREGDRFAMGDQVYLLKAELVPAHETSEAHPSGLAGQRDESQSRAASLWQRGGWKDNVREPSWWRPGEEAAGSGARGGEDDQADRQRIGETPYAVMDETVDISPIKEGRQDTPVTSTHKREPDPSGQGIPKDFVPGPWASPAEEAPKETSESYPSEQVSPRSGQEQEVSEPPQEVPKPPPETMRPRASDDEVLQALFKGLGMPIPELRAEELPALARTIGEMLRVALIGTMKLLRDRDSFKYQQAIRGTMVDGNPLKFSLGVDDAIDALLRPRRVGPSPTRAVGLALADIQAHVAAIMGATPETITRVGLLDRLDPKILERDWFRDVSGLEQLVPMTRKSKLWELYLTRYNELAHEAEDAFEHEFEDRFRRAYQNAIDQLRAAGYSDP